MPQKDENAAEQVPALIAAITPHARPAWRPLTTADDEGELTDSKFAGTPYLPEGVEWPVNKHTQEPMQLFLQLNSEQLPPEAGKPFGDGILQLFYAVDDDDVQDFETWEPFSEGVVARIVPLSGAGKTYEQSPMTDAFPTRRIVGWEQREEFPDSEDARLLGLDFSYEVWDAAFDEDEWQTGDKLLGWPLWVQSAEYPDCPESGEPMKYLFQIESEDNLPYMFGDVGTGYLMQSPVNPNILSFHWQCG